MADCDFTLDQAAEQLGVSARWLIERARAREVPHQRYGRRVAFTADQLAQIRHMHAVPVADHAAQARQSYVLAVATGATTRSQIAHRNRALREGTRHGT